MVAVLENRKFVRGFNLSHGMQKMPRVTTDACRLMVHQPCVDADLHKRICSFTDSGWIGQVSNCVEILAAPFSFGQTTGVLTRFSQAKPDNLRIDTVMSEEEQSCGQNSFLLAPSTRGSVQFASLCKIVGAGREMIGYATEKMLY